MNIRPATAADCKTLLRFIIELAEYEKAADQVAATEKKLRNTLFAANAQVFALLLEVDGEAQGFALYFFNYSTWQAQSGLYLEDLYVSPNARGKGYGKALIEYLAALAVKKNCGRFEWSVLDWNQPSIDFYESLGAKAKSEWIGYQLAGEALYQVAVGAETHN